MLDGLYSLHTTGIANKWGCTCNGCVEASENWTLGFHAFVEAFSFAAFDQRQTLGLGLFRAGGVVLVFPSLGQKNGF